MGSAPDLPMYEEYADTPFITRNRQLNPIAYDYLTSAMKNLDLYDGNTDAYQAVADAYTQSQWNDLNRAYNQAMNQQAANNYNRLGTSNATSNLYRTDDLQRQYNDLASRVASNTANMYNSLVNQEYQRRLSNLGTYANLFNTSGDVTENVDVRNWNTRNTNKDRQYMNEVNDYNAKMGRIGGTIEGLSAIGGAVAGGIFGGPMGSMMGQQAGQQAGGMLNNMFGFTPTNNALQGSNAGQLSDSINSIRSYVNSNNRGVGSMSGVNLGNNWGLNNNQGLYNNVVGAKVSPGSSGSLWGF